MSPNSSSTTKYVIDTNTLIGFSLWTPISLNSHFWNALEDALKNGKWILLDVVVKEILYDKPLQNWCKKQKAYVTTLSNDDRNEGININNTYPMIDQATFKSTVDTYIIAHAQRNGLGVFSRESPKDPNGTLNKIPDVCRMLGVPCVKKPEAFLNSIGYKN